MTKVQVSVVIGFRDWGADRIRRSAQSVMDSFDGISAECIISDYGSASPEPAKLVAQEIGAKYVYTAGDPVWSRARALNAGFQVAKGEYFISTDADMLFSPKAMRIIVETLEELSNCALFLQCRDLPPQMNDDYFSERAAIPWETLESEGRLRPRWGMGGMMAISATGFSNIRGFDERLHTYGGEDLDFARRAQRAGYRTVWVDHPEVRMYHMWHPPTLRTVEQTAAGRQAVEFNRNVVYNDKTFVRNTIEWTHRLNAADPLVTFAVATRGRSELLKQSIQSMLIQSVQDFEIVIVDDGPYDDTTYQAVASFNDPRIRYFSQEHSGISTARNRALDESRGQFTAVMDDDDLIPPQRLEWQLGALEPEYAGTVGSFVNFDEDTGDLNLIVSNIPSFIQALEKGGAPGHGTWLVRTEVLRSIRYDETISSGVDNNLFLRMLKSGYKFAHCGKPVLLRRIHKSQVTSADSTNQTTSAAKALQFLRFNLSTQRIAELIKLNSGEQFPRSAERSEMIELVKPFLPDQLIARDAKVTLKSETKQIPSFSGQHTVSLIKRDNVPIRSELAVRNATYEDLVGLASLGSNLYVSLNGSEASEIAVATDNDWIVDALNDYLTGSTQTSPIGVHLSTNAPQTKFQTPITYTSFDGATTCAITLAMLNSAEHSNEESLWIILGATALEHWT